MAGDNELREQILQVEADLEELTDAVGRCRKITLISKAGIAAGGTLILATILGAIGFDPYSPDWVDCGYYRRDGRSRVKREYHEANDERNESRGVTQSRID